MNESLPGCLPDNLLHDTQSPLSMCNINMGQELLLELQDPETGAWLYSDETQAGTTTTSNSATTPGGSVNMGGGNLLGSQPSAGSGAMSSTSYYSGGYGGGGYSSYGGVSGCAGELGCTRLVSPLVSY